MVFKKDNNVHQLQDAWYRLIFFGKIKKYLKTSKQKDPVILAQEVFELPGYRMHGPHYHSIVPAIIVTAYQNVKGERNPGKINAAIKRGIDFKGGSCGSYGVCGAAAGAGIASSVIEGTTPISIKERGNAQAAAGLALIELSKFGGPRCCQRESFTTIYSFINNTEFFNGIEITEHVCRQFSKNKECIRKRCPYFPGRKNKAMPEGPGV